MIYRINFIAAACKKTVTDISLNTLQSSKHDESARALHMRRWISHFKRRSCGTAERILMDSFAGNPGGPPSWVRKSSIPITSGRIRRTARSSADVCVTVLRHSESAGWRDPARHSREFCDRRSGSAADGSRSALSSVHRSVSPLHLLPVARRPTGLLRSVV